MFITFVIKKIFYEFLYMPKYQRKSLTIAGNCEYTFFIVCSNGSVSVMTQAICSCNCYNVIFAYSCCGNCYCFKTFSHCLELKTIGAWVELMILNTSGNITMSYSPTVCQWCVLETQGLQICFQWNAHKRCNRRIQLSELLEFCYKHVAAGS